ncbi:MAG: sensor histidine kinase [Nocardioidaceae bacterium]
MLNRLQESFEGERRFLDTASHELRTPLAALKTELDLALSRPRSLAEAQAALHSASEETDRLAQLADDLLVLSRAHRGRLPVHRAATSLAAVVGAARTHVAARAEAAGVQLRATAPAEWVHVDETRLRQALDNLLDNALRHTPSGGVVQVQATVEDGAVRVVVDDSGPGFPPDAAAMTLSQPGRLATGFGLGLAIVSAVAAGHGGGVTTITRPEGGGRVIVTLAEATD